MEYQTSNQPKRGISPFVVILLIIAIVIAFLCFKLTLSDNNENKQTEVEDTESVKDPNEDMTEDDEFYDGTFIMPKYNPESGERLVVDAERIRFPSGGYVIYGFPYLILEDQAVGETINAKLSSLVEKIILAKANELLNEDTEGSAISYQYELKSNEDYYSVIVTVDINEGITSSRECFAWNFSKDSGQLLDIYLHCSDRYTLAKAIDGCLTDAASYDTVIHTWLTDILTSEFPSDSLSYYFEDEHFVAVINERFRLNSADRDPILIKIPYSQIKSLISVS